MDCVKYAIIYYLGASTFKEVRAHEVDRLAFVDFIYIQCIDEMPFALKALEEFSNSVDNDDTHSFDLYYQ